MAVICALGCLYGILTRLPFPSGGRRIRRVVSEAPDEAKVGREQPRVKDVLITELLVSYQTEMILAVRGPEPYM